MKYESMTKKALKIKMENLGSVASFFIFIPALFLIFPFFVNGAFVAHRRTLVRSPSKVLSIAPSPDVSAEEERRTFLLKTSSAAVASPSLFLPTQSSVAATELDYTTTIPLSGGIEIPPIGIGAWAWGDSLFWGYDPSKDGDLESVFDYSLEQKIVPFYDTAELYGLGRSEKLLGKYCAASGERADKVVIATKFAAVPWKTQAKDVVDACLQSTKRLGGRKIDLYQIHFPNAWSNDAYWDGLAQCVEQGLVRSVGVSNYSSEALRAVHKALKARGIPLATNQIQMNLLYRFPLENGLMDTCNELGVQVLAYSPLCLGFLTGKYRKGGDLPSGPRGKLAEKLFESDGFEGLLQTMEDVAQKSGGKDTTLSQVALNWCRAKGSIPIPGARTVKQASQNIGCLSWKLSNDDLMALDEAASRVPAYIEPDKSPFAKKDINTGMIMFDS